MKHFICQIFGIWKFTLLFFFAFRWWATLRGERKSSTHFFWTDCLVVGKFLGLMEHDEQQRSWAYYSEQARSRWVRVSKVGKVSFVSSSHSAAYVKIKVSDATTSATGWRLKKHQFFKARANERGATSSTSSFPSFDNVNRRRCWLVQLASLTPHFIYLKERL